MRIHSVHIENFRGIKKLEWCPAGRLACLIGPGNAGKTTLLDAIELALLPRWYAQLSDDDFFGGRSDEPIVIEVTIGELPPALVREDRLGLHLRGWHETSGIQDEPSDDTESVLTIRFKLDASLEPAWTVVTDRTPDGVKLATKDREKLGLARLGDDAERQLTWMRGSALPRLGSSASGASEALAAANRAARSALKAAPPGEEFSAAASAAHAAATDFGAAPETDYTPQLGGGATIGLGAMELFEGAVPVRLTGLGSRRLAALGIENESIRDGAILLIDEVETGLEPHRIARLLAKLSEHGSTKGQVILTTHSPVVLRELTTAALYVVTRSSTGAEVRPVAADLQDVVRSVPEALLAKRILVCEGRTEHGVIEVLRCRWENTRKVPLAHIGGNYVTGSESGGTNAPKHAKKLASLGYKVALLGDDDDPQASSAAEMTAADVYDVRWAGKCHIEKRCALDLPLTAVQKMVDVGVAHRTDESVKTTIGAKLGRTLTSVDVPTWIAEGASDSDVREAVGCVASEKSWFKSHERGQELGAIILAAWDDLAGSDLREKLELIESWFYG